MFNINSQMQLGYIVAKYPRTIPVMNKYKLDYCCGGKESLEMAVDHLNLKALATQITDELNQCAEITVVNQEVVKDWSKESIGTLIDWILDQHHVFMTKTLNELNGLVLKILKVHYRTDGEKLLQLHHLFGVLKTELEAHLVKEEENLFPLMRHYEIKGDEPTKAAILKFIQDTEHEHDAAGDLFKEIERITDDFTPPADACFTYKKTYQLLDALEKDTFNHIHLENTILFSKIV